MRFWDASAVVPLLVGESMTSVCRRLYEEDPQLLVWWGTEVECTSAICRRERDGVLDAEAAVDAGCALDDMRRRWHEVQPTAEVQEQARRLLRLHPLRTADSLQLAAALAVSEFHPATLPFVTLDSRLARAARREGFTVESERS